MTALNGSMDELMDASDEAVPNPVSSLSSAEAPISLSAEEVSGRTALPDTVHGWGRWSEAAHRIGWVGVDQIISSLSNAGLTFFVAREIGATAFGAFAVAFTVYASLLGVSQAAGGNPFAIRRSAASSADQAEAMAAASGWPVVFGGVAGVACIAAGLAFGGQTGAALIAIGIFLPAMFLQDCWRQILVTIKRPKSAVVNDFVWAVVQFGLLAALAVAGVRAPWAYIVAWGVAAASGAALGLLQLKTMPRFGKLRAWLSDHKDLSGYLAAEWVTVLGASQLTILMCGVIAGVATVGALRGCITMIGPLNVLALTATTFMVPEISRRASSNRGHVIAAVAISAFFLTLTVFWGGALLLLPSHVGRDLLGETWAGARRVLLPMVFWQAGNVASLGPFTVLRGLGRARASFTVNAVLAPLLLTGGLVGVAVGGTVGAASGLASASWLVVPLWWREIRKALREKDAAHA